MPEIKVKLNFYAIELNGDKKLKSKYFLVSQQMFTCRNEARVYKPFYVTDKESSFSRATNRSANFKRLSNSWTQWFVLNYKIS